MDLTVDLYVLLSYSARYTASYPWLGIHLSYCQFIATTWNLFPLNIWRHFVATLTGQYAVDVWPECGDVRREWESRRGGASIAIGPSRGWRSRRGHIWVSGWGTAAAAPHGRGTRSFNRRSGAGRWGDDQHLQWPFFLNQWKPRERRRMSLTVDQEVITYFSSVLNFWLQIEEHLGVRRIRYLTI